MNIRNLLVGALVLVPAAMASADGGCPRSNPNPAPSAPAAPTAAAALGTHGGTLVVLGNAGNQFEVVQDPSLGKVTVYAVESPSRTFVVAQAPVIALEGRRELTLVPVQGERNAWSVTDDSLRGANLSGRLMVRTNDRWETAALTAPASDSAATRATENPAPAVPTAWNEPMAAHGGRVLAACGGSFEWVRDTVNGKATLYMLPQGATKLSLDMDPVLSIKSAAGDARTFNMTAVPGSQNAWEVSVDVLKGDAPSDGTVKVSIDGRPCELNLRDASTANGSSLNGAIALHGGRMLVLGQGADLTRLELVHNPATGLVTVYAPVGADVKLDAPVLVLRTDAGDEKRVTLTKADDGSWSATEEVLKTPALNGKIEAKVGDRSLNAALPSANAKADEVPSGDMPARPEAPKNTDEARDTAKDDTSAQPVTSALVFGGGIAKLELRRDAGLGRVTLTTPSDVRAARLDGAPVLVLETPSGKKELTFEKGATDGTWTVTSEELKATAPMKGVVRITIEGKQFEADTAPQFADAKPTPNDMR